MAVDVADLVATLRGEDLGFSLLMLRADAAMTALGEHTNRVVGLIGKFALGLTGLAAGGLIASVKAAADFQTALVQVANNTNMTNAQLAVMQDAVQRLAAGSNVPLDQLVQGFKHLVNIGFTAQQAVVILQQAMMSAASTGADTGEVANVLGVQMHEFGISVSQAAGAMNVLHTAAAMSNADLSSFADSASKAGAMGANLHVPLVQVDAALSALSRHLPLNQAATALAQEFAKIANPAAGAEKLIRQLSATTGIDLVGDFSAAGLASRGFTQVLDDVTRATGGNVTEMLKLIPATRGGLAAMILTGTGAKDYREILAALNDQMTGKTNPTFRAYQRLQATVGFQMGQLSNQVQLLGITIDNVLLPPILALAKDLTGLVTRFANWVRSSGAVQSILSGLKTLLQTQLLPRLADLKTFITQVVTETTKWLAQHPGVVKMLADIGKDLLIFAAGGAAAKAVQFMIGLLADLLAYFVGKNALSTVIGLLAVAWTQNWGGMQQKLQTVWGVIHPILSAIGSALDKLDPGVGAAGDLAALAAALVGVAAALRAIEAAQGAIAIIKGLAGIFGGGKGGGGGGGSLGAGADKAIVALTAAITKQFPPLTTAITTHVPRLITALATQFPLLRSAITTHVAALATAIDTHVPALTDALDHLAHFLPFTLALDKTALTAFADLTSAIKNLHVTIKGGSSTVSITGAGSLTNAITTYFPSLTTAIANLGTQLKTVKIALPKLPPLKLDDAILVTALDNLTAAIQAWKPVPGGHGGGAGSGHGTATVAVSIDLKKALQDAVTALARSPVDVTPALYLNHGTLRQDLAAAISAIKPPVDLAPALTLGSLAALLARAVAATKPPVDLSPALAIKQLRTLLFTAVHGITTAVDLSPALAIKQFRTLLYNAVHGVTTPVDLTPALSLKGLVSAIKDVLGQPINWGQSLDQFAKSFWQGTFGWIGGHAGDLVIGEVGWGNALANFAKSFWTAIFEWLKNNAPSLGGILGGLGHAIGKLLVFSPQASQSTATNANYQQLGLSANGGAAQPMQIILNVDGKQLANILMLNVGTARRMSPELVSA